MIDSRDENVTERGEVITKNKKDEEDISSLLSAHGASDETEEAKEIAHKLDMHTEDVDRDERDDELAPPAKVTPPHEEALLTATTPSTPPPHVPSTMISGFGRPRQHRAKKALVWVLALVVGLAAGGGGVYAFYRNDINKPVKTVTVTRTITVPAKETTPAVTRSLQFATAGVQYPLDAKYDDFVLVSAPSPKTGVQSIDITSRKLMLAQATAYPSDSAKQAACSPFSSPLGMLWVVDKNHLGTAANDPLSMTGIQAATKLGHAKDLGTSYLVYTAPQQVCSDNKTVSDQQTQLIQQQSLKDLIQSIVVIK